MFDLSDFTKLTNTDSEDEDNQTNENKQSVDQVFETKTVTIRNQELNIREFHFSATNAGYVWPSTFYIIDYIMEHINLFNGEKKIIEIGSGTGILSIYLAKQQLNITSSDIDNQEVTDNIKYNQQLNNVHFNHIPHTWGDVFPEDQNDFDILIASDIILYVAYFEKLMVTLTQILSKKPNSFMIMAYKRKLYDSKKFFVLLDQNNFSYEVIGSKMWIIRLKK